MAGHHGKRSSQTANQHLSPHTHLITILSEIPMGYFSLVKKKTNDIANKDANMGFTSTKVGSSFCQASPELDQSPRKRKPTSFKPPLSINTDIASAFTPPLTPSDSSQSRRGSWGNSPGKRGRDKSAGVLLKTPQSTVESTITPPQSPSSRKSGGTTFTRRTSLTSLSLLKTPRQRKLQEIRQGNSRQFHLKLRFVPPHRVMTNLVSQKYAIQAAPRHTVRALDSATKKTSMETITRRTKQFRIRQSRQCERPFGPYFIDETTKR